MSRDPLVITTATTVPRELEAEQDGVDFLVLLTAIKRIEPTNRARLVHAASVFFGLSEVKHV
jgi:hypothetical protein